MASPTARMKKADKTSFDRVGRINTMRFLPGANLAHVYLNSDQLGTCKSHVAL
jgi:hypothetical protein